MYKPIFALLTFAAAAIGLANAASPDPQQTQQLLGVVRSNADLAARARALQQLALVATKDAVAPLAAMLSDEKLGQYARDVLEVMPDPEAGDALRTALSKLKGNALIGVVNSLGVRGEDKSVEALGRLASGNAREVAAPALLALGRIGSADALRIIESALARGPAELRAAAAEACLIMADRQARDGKHAAAMTLYEKLRHADLPLPIRVSATRGAITLPGNSALTLLVQQLHSPERAMRDVALLALRELRDPQVAPVTVNELDRLAPEMQALLIVALADRGEEGARVVIEKRAASGNEEVRVAALRALSRLGGTSSLPILLAAMRSPSSPAVADAALMSLGRISVPETNAFLQQALSSGDASLRIKLIGVLAERKAEGATSDLTKLAADPDLELGKAALRALGSLARPDELPRLIRLALSVSDEAAKSLADRTIVLTSMRVLQPERRADAVLTAFREETDPATKAALVRPLGAILRSMGGSHEVFSALRTAWKDASSLVRDAALKALADWPDATPTTLLLEVARDQNVTPAQRELALSGALRMVTNVAAGRERSPLNVVAAFEHANRAVTTSAEKLMIVSSLGNLKRPEAVAMLKPYLDDPAVQVEAALAVIQIAPSMLGGKNSVDLEPMLAKIAATAKDESLRRKAAQLVRSETPAMKEKGKAKKAAAVASAASAVAGLFNGKDLAGWDGDPAVWRVRDGTIVGGSLEGNPRNEFLATTRSYRNFVLRLEYKLVGTEGFVNGGVQFRSVRVTTPPNEMSGYQADIGAGHSGSLYDESRRKKFLARAEAEQVKRLERVGDWNRYEIRCEGPAVELMLNGEKTVSYVETDPTVLPDGLIALQIHGNCKAEIAFRNFEISELR